MYDSCFAYLYLAYFPLLVFSLLFKFSSSHLLSVSNARKEKCSTDAGVMKTMLVNSVHVQVVVDKMESSEACERSEGGSAKDQR